MREFNIDLIDLLESKKNDIRKAMREEVEQKNPKANTLVVAEIVNGLMETFICVARVESLEEVK